MKRSAISIHYGFKLNKICLATGFHDSTHFRNEVFYMEDGSNIRRYYLGDWRICRRTGCGYFRFVGDRTPIKVTKYFPLSQTEEEVNGEDEHRSSK